MAIRPESYSRHLADVQEMAELLGEKPSTVSVVTLGQPVVVDGRLAGQPLTIMPANTAGSEWEFTGETIAVDRKQLRGAV